MHKFAYLMLVLFTVLTGCSDYRPFRDGVGFSEKALGDDGYEVTYQGKAGMPVAEARKYALVRASELAVLKNMPYFRIAKEQIYLSYQAQYRSLMAVPANDFSTTGGMGPRPTTTTVMRPSDLVLEKVPEVTLQIRLRKEPGENGIAAAFLIRQAQADQINLSAGVAEKAAAMPTEPATLPPAPEPVDKRDATPPPG